MHIKAALSICVALISTIISSVNAVTISCITGIKLTQFCQINYNQPYATVQRTTEENSYVNCVQGVNYGYLYYNPYQSYVWATIGCGGTFEVTQKQVTSTWAAWGVWSACSVSCGVGFQARFRTCPGGATTACGSGSASVSKTCTQPTCHATISWNSWGAWSACSATCGVGAQLRNRACSTGSIYNCITTLGGSSQDSISCNLGICPTTVAVTPTIANSPLCGRENVFGYRIIGGSMATDCQYPWMTLIYNRFTRTICGGSILDSTHILTAAHCLYSASMALTPIQQLIVLTGSSKMPLLSYVPKATRRSVSTIKVHEQYNHSYLDNDIAILTLTEAITFNECHRPICLPPKNSSPVGMTGCKVMGWGKTFNDKDSAATPNLLHTTIKVDTDTTCATAYRQYYNKNSKLCGGGGGTGSCSGDSGGPLLCPGSDGRFYQYAIVSAGRENSCGINQGLYTRVTYFLDWIQNNSK